VADDVVVLTKQLAFLEDADLDEVRIHIGDVTVEIRGGENIGGVADGNVAASDRQVHAHGGLVNKAKRVVLLRHGRLGRCTFSVPRAVPANIATLR